MYEYYRTGKGNEYIEVSLDWDSVDENKLVTILYWLQEIVAGDPYHNPKLAKAMREVADSIDERQTNDKN